MKFKYWVVSIVAASLSSMSLISDALGQTRQPKPTAPVAIVGGTIHTVSGGIVDNGRIIIEGGKIVAVGDTSVEVPSGAIEIDASGKHVYPGLFETYSQLGLTEIESIRASLDHAETGSFNPNVKANVAVNPDSELLPVTRANGVLLVVSAPTGGAVSGQSAVLQLDGWTYEDLTLDASAGMHVVWPESKPLLGPSKKPKEEVEEDAEKKEIRELLDPMVALRRFFEMSRDYWTVKKNGGEIDFDARLESMLPVFEKELPVIAHAETLGQIQSAVSFANEFGFKVIIYGGYDAPDCADLLKKHDVPVIVSAVHRVPRRRQDAYDYAYQLPKMLKEKGVRFCISGSAREENYNTRNLPYHAGTAVAYGLDHEEALRAITLSPAEIFGCADRVGSLEVGKDATLIITTGDPLDIRSEVTAAYVQGRPLDLASRHTKLYEKYQEKYRQKEAELPKQ